MRTVIFTALALCPLTGAVSAQDIKVVSYNVESDHDTVPAKVAADIRAMGDAYIWGLQEVEDRDTVFAFRDAMQLE